MRCLIILLAFLLPVHLQAHGMKRADQDIGVSTFFNRIDFILDNNSDNYTEYVIEVLEKDTFNAVPKEGNWAFNSKNDTIKIAPNNQKRVLVRFKPSTEVRKYYVCTKAINTKYEGNSFNYTRVCLRLLLQPTVRKQ